MAIIIKGKKVSITQGGQSGLDRVTKVRGNPLQGIFKAYENNPDLDRITSVSD